MCTVTWAAQPDGGMALCFSRDEQHGRAAGLSPRIWEGGFLAPVDGAAGGTWLAVRSDGLILALLNHYPDGHRMRRGAPSRGDVIPALARAGEVVEAQRLRKLAAGRNPFRLLAIGDGANRLFTWDGRHVSSRLCGETGMVTGSSWNTLPVIAARRHAWLAWQKANPQPALEDLRHFHAAATHPRGAAWAVCMRREDARTVSLNTVLVEKSRAVMTHQSRSPDADHFSAAGKSLSLALTAPAFAA